MKQRLRFLLAILGSAPLCAMLPEKTGTQKPFPTLQLLAATASLDRFSGEQLDNADKFPKQLPLNLRPILHRAEMDPIREFLNAMPREESSDYFIEQATLFCEKPCTLDGKEKVELVLMADGYECWTLEESIFKRVGCLDFANFLADRAKNVAISAWHLCPDRTAVRDGVTGTAAGVSFWMIANILWMKYGW